MAKVKGPLMSMEASGSYGSTLVFGRRLGSNVVRQLVKPSNPQTAGQMLARNRVRVFGALQKFVSGTMLKLAGKTSTDKELIAAVTPSGQRWNSYMQQVGIGSGGISYTAARAAFALLTELEKAAWETAAGALTPVILAVAQKDAGGTDASAVPAGEVFFIHVYTLSLMGITATPTGTPPTYA